MKSLIASLMASLLLAGCALHAPQPPMPPDEPRVPVNATEPLTQGR